MKQLIPVLLGIASIGALAQEVPIVFDSSFYTANGKVFDASGNEYINTSLYYSQRTGDSPQACVPLALLIDPSTQWDQYPEYDGVDLSDSACQITKVGEPGIFYIPTPVISDDGTSAVAAGFCQDYAGYAPPGVWSPGIAGPGHIGPSYFKISVKWYGDTYVSSAVRYWSSNNEWTTSIFNAQTSFTTGNAASNIYMSYMGIPLGSSVLTTIC